MRKSNWLRYGLLTLSFAVLPVLPSGCKSVQNSQVKDDFYGPGAKEYTVTGSDYVTLNPEDAAQTEDLRVQAAELLAGQRLRAVGYFLQAYIEDKEPDDPNKSYGGFNADVRFGNDDSPKVTYLGNNNYAFNFSFNIAGYKDLIKSIQTDQGVKSKDFVLQTAELNNKILGDLKLHFEWFRNPPYQVFDPKSPEFLAVDRVRKVAAHIEPQATTYNAFFPIDKMIKNGKLTFAIHFGWDGQLEEDYQRDLADKKLDRTVVPVPAGHRYDLDLAEQLFHRLVKVDGFKSPVGDDFARYTAFVTANGAQLPPLTKMVSIGGQKVTAEVQIFFAGRPSVTSPADKQLAHIGPNPDVEADATKIANAFKFSLATKSVVMYLGHSGVRRGFNLANWNVVPFEGNIPPAMISKLNMSPDFQLIVAEGCQTYYLADPFWANPAKANHQNLNLITSLGFTDADSIKTAVRLVEVFTNSIPKAPTNMTIAPRVLDVLTMLDPANIIPPKPTKKGVKKHSVQNADDDPVYPVYGLHGIEEDPAKNPLAGR